MVPQEPVAVKKAPLFPFESPDVLDTYQGGYGSHLSPPPSPLHLILVWVTFGGGGGGAGFPWLKSSGLSGKSGIHVHSDHETWQTPHPMCQ